MTNKKKKEFDCVEMKNKIQQELLEEYEMRKDEFDSYFDFLDYKSATSKWQKKMFVKFKQKKAS